MIAPTGTIGLVMDCDTTGIEPDFALVKFKKLAGGGYFKIINQSVPAALEKLGYGSAQIEEIVCLRRGPWHARQRAGINHTALIGHGFGPAQIDKIEAALGGVRHPLRVQPVDAGRGVLPRGARHPAVEAADPDLRPAASSRLRKADIDAANDHVCGTMTLEGAPHLRRTLPVFDCANPCGKKGTRVSVGQSATST